MGSYTLWCMNRVARWQPLDDLVAALADHGFLRHRHDVRLGDRRPFDRTDVDAEESMPGVLSYETTTIDEYFVPILVKCLGDPHRFLTRFGGQMNEQGKRLLRDLLTWFPQFYGPEARWRKYWVADGAQRMFTATDGPTPHAGFYEIVASQPRGNKAVLVGYSQDGLVARFLAFLDAALMKPDARAIAGFITVQAPNAGSPLANPANEPTVARGLLAVLAGALSYPVSPGDTYRELGEALGKLATGRLEVRPPRDEERIEPELARRGHADRPRFLDVAALGALIDAAMADADAKRTSDAQGTLRFDMLSTTRKWLTGLSPGGAETTAFGDLSPSALDNRHTVLGLLAEHTPSVLHGAVVGTDNGLADLVAASLPWWGPWAKNLLVWSGALKDAISASEKAYRQIVMNELEAKRPLGPREAAIAQAYANGCRIVGVDRPFEQLPPYAHDFVIPSVSHAMGPINAARNPASQLLGNLVNPKATHIGGGQPDGEESDRPLVVSLLERMGRQLPSL
jgi:hypothetical protein